MVKVAIIETNVFGAKAYVAKCLACGERCHKQAHDRESTAVRHAEQHNCKEVVR